MDLSKLALVTLAITLGFACAAPSPPSPSAPAVSVPSATPAADDAPEAAGPTREADASEPIALALVVDRSGSMTGLPLEMTLKALRAAVRELQPDDWVTIIVFDSVPRSVVETRKRGAPDALDAAIAGINAAGGTDILPALALAGQSLAADSAPKRRHVILMSDGQAPSDGMEQIVAKVVAAGATISTIALGSDADSQLLGRIAELGGGRFVPVVDPRELPGVFRGEVGQARKR